jgi:hypothetical protein
MPSGANAVIWPGFALDQFLANNPEKWIQAWRKMLIRTITNVA